MRRIKNSIKELLNDAQKRMLTLDLQKYSTEELLKLIRDNSRYMNIATELIGDYYKWQYIASVTTSSYEQFTEVGDNLSSVIRSVARDLILSDSIDASQLD